ncbi:hypothetical protein ACO0QE_002053 [Hanseniaspora vineae]
MAISSLSRRASTLERSSSTLSNSDYSGTIIMSQQNTSKRTEPLQGQSPYQEKLLRLKVELKKWEYRFISKNKRSPKKTDIQILPEVRKMYKEYNTIKKLAQNEQKIQEKKKLLKEQLSPSQKWKSPQKPFQRVTPIKKQDDDGADELLDLSLGPTPQIHGKVQSILDAFVSPLKNTPNTVPLLKSPNQKTNISQAKKKLDFGTDETEEEENVFGCEEHILNGSSNDTETLSMAKETPSNDLPLKPLQLKAPKQSLRKQINSPNKYLQNVSCVVRRTPVSKFHCDESDKEGYASSLGSPSPLIKLVNQHNSKFHKSLYELAKEREQIMKEFQGSGVSVDLMGQLKSEQVYDYDSTENDETTEEKAADENLDEEDVEIEYEQMKNKDEEVEVGYEGMKTTSKELEIESEDGQFADEESNANNGETATIAISVKDSEEPALSAANSNGKKSKRRSKYENTAANNEKLLKQRRRKIIKVHKNKASTKKQEMVEQKIMEKDLHEELRKLKQKSVNEFYGIPSVHEDETEDEAFIDPIAKKNPKKKKYNLVSENFVRMKIHKKKNSKFRNFRR